MKNKTASFSGKTLGRKSNEKKWKILRITGYVLLVVGFLLTIFLGNVKNLFYSYIGLVVMVIGIIILFVKNHYLTKHGN
jgi:uncharacterized membrane protein HdeD (DUF308 family)